MHYPGKQGPGRGMERGRRRVHVLVSGLIQEAALLMQKGGDVVLVLREGLVPAETATLLAQLLATVPAICPALEDGHQTWGNDGAL